MNKTKQTLTSLLLATSLVATPAFGQQEQLFLTGEQFKQCTLLTPKIIDTNYQHKSLVSKAQPHLDEHRRLYAQGKIISNKIRPLADKLATYGDSVPENEYSEYKQVFNKYQKLLIEGKTLYKQGDLKFEDYKVFKPEIDRLNTKLNNHIELFKENNCDKEIVVKRQIIKENCPQDSKNEFCKSWLYVYDLK